MGDREREWRIRGRGKGRGKGKEKRKEGEGDGEGKEEGKKKRGMKRKKEPSSFFASNEGHPLIGKIFLILFLCFVLFCVEIILKERKRKKDERSEE